MENEGEKKDFYTEDGSDRFLRRDVTYLTSKVA
jgi:hypothetical protein